MVVKQFIIILRKRGNPMQDWKIRRKIFFVILSCFLIVVMLIIADIIKEKNDNKENLIILETNIRQDYDQSIKNQVSSVLSMIVNLEEVYKKDNLSEEEIKNKIADTIRNLRYGESGYFWVDKSDGTNVVLYGSEVEGTNRYNFQDINGKYIFHELLEKAIDGGGFTDYYFPKEGEKSPQPKRAYSVYYERFDWVIGTGIYTDTIDEIINNRLLELNRLLQKNIMKNIIFSCSLLILILIGNLFTSKNIINPLLFASSYAKSIAESKFDSVIPPKFLKRKDEIGILLSALSEMNQSIQQNIKEKEGINHKLSIDNDFLNIVLKSIGDGIVVIDKEYRIKTINETVSSHFHIRLNEVQGLTFDIVFGFKDMNKNVIDNNSICNARMECYLYRNDFEIFVDGTFYKILNEDKSVDGYVYVFHDISERIEKNREIDYLNYHDQLTGLYNRRFFEMKCSELLVDMDISLGLIVSDLNALKLTNDSLGHLMGDELLIKFANVLKENFTDAEVVARIGGDEFAILLSNSDYVLLENRIKKVKQELAKCHVGDFPVSAAFGCAIHNNSIFSFADTFKIADDKMYQDKMIENTNIKNKILISIIQKYFELFPVKREEVHMAVKIAKRFSVFLSLDSFVVKRIEKAAVVYDIGTISIKNNYFWENRKLTTKEYEEIKSHPAAAFHILKNVNNYIEVAEIVLCHHENIDGSGYPRGLAGNEIPLESRILSLITDYCGMRSEREYREALTNKQAILEIEKNIGLKYDLELAAQFLHFLEYEGEFL